MRFATPVQMEKTGKSRWGRPEYILTAPLVYKSGREGWSNVHCEVPVGFCTDLASAPWGLRWLLGKRKWWKPPVLHDYLYTQIECSRFFADAMFREAMKDEGVPLWRRVAAYYAVRIFGWMRRAT